MSDLHASLSEDDLAFVAAHRESALRDRDAAYFRARAAYWRSWGIEGAIGLAGLWLFAWSGQTLGLLLLFGFWTSWLIDVAQYRWHGPALRRAHLADAATARFWGLVKVLRGRLRQRPDPSPGPPPGVGLVVDLVAGGAATALALAFIPPEVLHAALTPSLGVAALGVLAGIGATLPRRFVPDPQGHLALPAFRYGQRGIGLLLVVFASGAVGGGRWIAAVYGFFLLMGLVEGVLGARMERDAAEWVRRQAALTPAPD